MGALAAGEIARQTWAGAERVLIVAPGVPRRAQLLSRALIAEERPGVTWRLVLTLR